MLRARLLCQPPLPPCLRGRSGQSRVVRPCLVQYICATLLTLLSATVRYLQLSHICSNPGPVNAPHSCRLVLPKCCSLHSPGTLTVGHDPKCTPSHDSTTIINDFAFPRANYPNSIVRMGKKTPTRSLAPKPIRSQNLRIYLDAIVLSPAVCAPGLAGQCLDTQVRPCLG